MKIRIMIVLCAILSIARISYSTTMYNISLNGTAGGALTSSEIKYGDPWHINILLSESGAYEVTNFDINGHQGIIGQLANVARIDRAGYETNRKVISFPFNASFPDLGVKNGLYGGARDLFIDDPTDTLTFSNLMNYSSNEKLFVAWWNFGLTSDSTFSELDLSDLTPRFDFYTAPVPEPGTLLLLGMVLPAVALLRWRSR